MKLSEDEQAEDEDLAITAEEGVISVNDEVILHEKIDNKNQAIFLYSRYVSRKKLFSFSFFSCKT